MYHARFRNQQCHFPKQTRDQLNPLIRQNQDSVKHSPVRSSFLIFALSRRLNLRFFQTKVPWVPVISAISPNGEVTLKRPVSLVQPSPPNH